MAVLVSRSYSCDSCGRALDEHEAMYAHLPRYPATNEIPMVRMRTPGGGIVRAGHDGIYCSWACIRAAVEQFALGDVSASD